MTRAGVAAAVLVAFAAACAPEGGLQITIEADGLVAPEDLDAVEVEVVATETPDTSAGGARSCEPVGRAFSVDGEPRLELPLVVVLHPGGLDWRCVAVRATGLRGGAPVVSAEELYCLELASFSAATLTLEAGCHVDRGPPACGPGLGCRVAAGSAGCAPTGVGELFEGPHAFGPCDGSDL